VGLCLKIGPGWVFTNLFNKLTLKSYVIIAVMNKLRYLNNVCKRFFVCVYPQILTYGECFMAYFVLKCYGWGRACVGIHEISYDHFKNRLIACREI
jgi:hypothetical protein